MEKQQCLLNDIVYDILSRMPVKSLIRFRCVSKSFGSTITDPKFIATHLNQAISLSNNNNSTHNGYLLYTPHPSSPDIEEELHTVVYNTDHSLTEVSSFEIPYVLGGANIVAFCNGLLCLTNNSEKNLADQSLYLWNPSIKMFKIVPTQFPDHLSVSGVTFGFAHQNNDFKILRLVCFASGGAEAQVYTLEYKFMEKV
ncbi:F-box protein CPR1-like [Quercus lobata]|uniref:F-box protein CPR1-like n=1 Tax=Quercus lobata TaxID=97700 RepID=UPI0012442BEC|nr:F-box protein CPR1-like [Quercus lobata]